MSDLRPPIPPEWHDDLRRLIDTMHTDCETPYVSKDSDCYCRTHTAARVAMLPFLTALPVEEPKPTHDPEVVEALARADVAVGFEGDPDAAQTNAWLDALADEGYEVVRSIALQAGAGALKDRIAQLSTERDNLYAETAGRIAELEAENKRQRVELANQRHMRVRLEGAFDSLRRRTAAQSGGGDAGDREAPGEGERLQSPAETGSSPPPSSECGHDVCLDIGQGCRYPHLLPSDDDLDGAAEAAHAALYPTSITRWPDCGVAYKDRLRNVVRAVREHNAGRAVTEQQDATAETPAWVRPTQLCPACGGRGWRLDLDARCEHCNPCCDEHFPSEAMTPEEQADHICPVCGWYPGWKPDTAHDAAAPVEDWEPSDEAVERAMRAHRDAPGGDMRSRVRAALRAAGQPPSSDFVFWWERAVEMTRKRDALRAQLADRDAEIERLRRMPTVAEVRGAWDEPKWRHGENHDIFRRRILAAALAAIESLRGGDDDG